MRVRPCSSLTSLSSKFIYDGNSAWYVEVSGSASVAISRMDSQLQATVPFLLRTVSPPCMC